MSDWTGADLDMVNRPLDTVREAVREYAGDGEGIDDAILRKFTAKIEATALRNAANEVTKKNTRAGVGFPTRDSIQLWDMAERIEREADE